MDFPYNDPGNISNLYPPTQHLHQGGRHLSVPSHLLASGPAVASSIRVERDRERGEPGSGSTSPATTRPTSAHSNGNPRTTGQRTRLPLPEDILPQPSYRLFARFGSRGPVSPSSNLQVSDLSASHRPLPPIPYQSLAPPPNYSAAGAQSPQIYYPPSSFGHPSTSVESSSSSWQQPQLTVTSPDLRYASGSGSERPSPTRWYRSAGVGTSFDFASGNPPPLRQPPSLPPLGQSYPGTPGDRQQYPAASSSQVNGSANRDQSQALQAPASSFPLPPLSANPFNYSHPYLPPINPPITRKASYNVNGKDIPLFTAEYIAHRYPTPQFLYILDPTSSPLPPSSYTLSYLDLLAQDQDRAEAAIWAEQDRFRQARQEAYSSQFDPTRQTDVTAEEGLPRFVFLPTYPVINPPLTDRGVRREPGIHLLPAASAEEDPWGRMPPKKAVSARPKEVANGENGSVNGRTGNSSRRRTEVERIGGVDRNVIVLSDDSEETTGSVRVVDTNGNVAGPAGAAGRRRAPPRTVNAPTASTTTTTTNSGRKRKADESEAGSVSGRPAAKKATGKIGVNGKAGTSVSTATQSTIATTIGINATDAIMNNGYKKPQTNGYGAASGSGAAHVPAAPVIAQLPPAPDGPIWDDKDGHYIVTPNTFIGHNDKYRIIRLLGQGTFGKVVEARETSTNRKVAIKIIRAVQKYRDASAIEIRVLHTLKSHDPHNLHKCIHLLETFDYRNHVCLVNELLGVSVFDFLKENKFQPFPERHIQDFARSLLKSLAYVHSLQLIHTDLKPENILLAQNGYETIGDRRSGAKQKHILKNTDIRLIDFGSATFSNEFHSSVVSTRHYRAPEIILGLGWSFPCDLFSVGCILVEFFTGDALFQTHDNLEHLAMMEVVMGKMPTAMANRACKLKGEFFKGNKLDFPNANTSKNSKKFVKGMLPLNDLIPQTTRLRIEFLDLVQKLLAFDPAKRINVHQALSHPYFKESTPSVPTFI